MSYKELSVLGPRSVDAYYMALALAQAAKGLGSTSPNPPVGCVIVQAGEIVGQGFHARAGEPHAEVLALQQAGARARGATVYVTLEPCAHFGRTPPCTGALMVAGVSRVVVAATDPHPQVNGRGLEQLRAAGIGIETGVLEAQARQQQAGFRSVLRRRRPHVIYKYAMTLDGKVAAHAEANGRVSSPESRRRVMQWRHEADAIAVGRGTVQLDNPRLTTRGIEGAKDARVVVFDRRGRTPPEAAALRPSSILVVGPSAHSPLLTDPRLTVVRAASVKEALEHLAELGLSLLLLEGGPTLASAFFAEHLIDELRVFVSPKLLGAGLSPLSGAALSMESARQLSEVSTELIGGDVLMTGYLNH